MVSATVSNRQRQIVFPWFKYFFRRIGRADVERLLQGLHGIPALTFYKHTEITVCIIF